MPRLKLLYVILASWSEASTQTVVSPLKPRTERLSSGTAQLYCLSYQTVLIRGLLKFTVVQPRILLEYDAKFVIPRLHDRLDLDDRFIKLTVENHTCCLG